MNRQIFSVLMILNVCAFIKSEVIEIDDGKLEGTVLKTRKGLDVYAFMNIPFAEPPIGRLRFHSPIPNRKWNGILNAKQFGPACMQNNDGPDESVSENCLQLNVFTKELNSINLKPTIVYIHGGGYVAGSAVGYLPSYLLDRDIVLVTINYRLGPFGFLATGTKDAYGNMGLKDQVLALKWVQKNIAHFGGNPDQVTISGLSAGSFSVTAQMGSVMSQGLFHRAIGMSGAITWQTGLDRDNMNLVKQVAKRLSCPINVDDMIPCLQTKSAKDIIQAGSRSYYGCLVMPWLPVVEQDFGQERLFTADQNKLFKSGKFNRVPVIVGITTDEFISPVVPLLNNKESLELLNNKFSEIASNCFYFRGNGIISTEKIAELLKKHYLPYDKIDKTSFNSLHHLCADGSIGYAVHRFAHYASPFTDVYYYKFSYSGRFSNFLYPRNKPYGIHHGDDNMYVLSTHYDPEIKESDPENFMVERMTRIWEQFSKYGNPNKRNDEFLADLNWPKLDKTTEYFLDNGKHMVEKQGLYLERYHMWDSLDKSLMYSEKDESNEEIMFKIIKKNSDYNFVLSLNNSKIYNYRSLP
ncbi:hypothetical protein ACKWTF_009844 [Chironomus riparius]